MALIAARRYRRVSGWVGAACALPWIFFVCGAKAQAVDVKASISPGYDSNPAQSQYDEQALAFVHYGLSAARRVRRDDVGLELAVSGWYRDYESANDSHRLTLGGDWSKRLDGGRSRLSIGVEGSTYRDQLVPEDERDETGLSLSYRRLFSARVEWGLSAQLRHSWYRNPSLPWSGRPDSGGGTPGRSVGAPDSNLTRSDEPGQSSGQRPGSGEGSGSGGEFGSLPPLPVATERDDDFVAVGFDATYYWSPALSATLDLMLARNDSSQRLETHDRYAAALSLAYQPASEWRLGVSLAWDGYRYRELPQGFPRRNDDRLSVAASVTRFVGDGELFCRVRFVDNDSNVLGQSYDQTVSRCGLAWHF